MIIEHMEDGFGAAEMNRKNSDKIRQEPPVTAVRIKSASRFGCERFDVA